MNFYDLLRDNNCHIQGIQTRIFISNYEEYEVVGKQGKKGYYSKHLYGGNSQESAIKYFLENERN